MSSVGRAIDWRYALLLAISGAAVLALSVHGSIPQDQSYHAFADRRTLFGVPNFWNVASNAAFLIAGIVGLLALRTSETPMRREYTLLFVGTILIAFGSAYYHLRPDDATLVWDRLPMTVAFMSFFAIILDRIREDLGRRQLPFLLIAGVASVVYWHLTNDLRPYIVVQFLPMILIPLIVILFPTAVSRDRYIWGMMGAYAIAKVVEVFDEPIFTATFVSGHTLKHVIAAGGIFLIVLAVRRETKWPREPLSPEAVLDALASTRGRPRQYSPGDSSHHFGHRQYVDICDEASVPTASPW